MKIRTDFVTNSSSSSFVTINVYTKKGDIYSIEREQEIFDSVQLPRFQDGKLIMGSNNDEDEIQTYEVNNVIELFSLLYFNEDSSIDYDVAKTVFQFLIGKLSGKKLLKQLSSEEGFEELEDIDPSDYDDTEDLNCDITSILEDALDNLSVCVYLDDNDINEFKEVVKNVNSLSEIDQIEVKNNCYIRDEFMENYYTKLDEIIKSNCYGNFPTIHSTEPNFINELTKWLNILKNDILGINTESMEDLEPLVKEALDKGEPRIMIPCSVCERQKSTLSFSDSSN